MYIAVAAGGEVVFPPVVVRPRRRRRRRGVLCEVVQAARHLLHLEKPAQLLLVLGERLGFG